MRNPTDSDSNATLLKLGRYAGARVHADPAVRSMAPLIRSPMKGLKAAITRRNEAEDEQTDADAVRDYEFDVLSALVMDLGREAEAHFKGRTGAGFTRIFAAPPSEIATTAIKARKAVFDGLLGKLDSPQTPNEFDKVGRAIAAQWEKTQQAEEAVGVAGRTLAEAVDQIAAARAQWFTGYTRLQAQLTDKFPASKARVDKYFRDAPKPKKAKPAPAVVVAPGGAGGPKPAPAPADDEPDAE